MSIFDGTFRGCDFWGEISRIDRSTDGCRFAARVTRVVYYQDGQARDLPGLKGLRVHGGLTEDDARGKAIQELQLTIGRFRS
jgi:hypothetical protein